MLLPELLSRLPAGVTVRQNPQNKFAGIFIGVGVPADVAQALGTDPDEAHVTLLYLGKLTDTTDLSSYEALLHDLSELASQHPALSAHFGGRGTFTQPTQDVHYLSVDCPGLSELHTAAMSAATEHGLPVSREHGFTPHVTMGYGQPGSAHPARQVPPDPWPINALELWIAGTRLIMPFAQTLSKAEQPDETPDPAPADTNAARLLYAQLTGHLVSLHAGERHLLGMADRIAHHHDAARTGLGQAIPAVRGSALEDAALHHADEAARARRVAGTR